MTVLDALEAGDRDAALAELARLTPAQRRRLAPELIGRHKRWHRGDFRSSPGNPNQFRFVHDEGTREQREAADACVLAVATARELQGLPDLFALNQPPAVLAVAEVVRPAWIESQSLESLADSGHLRWSTGEALIEAGHIRRPTSDVLVESLVEHLGAHTSTPLVDLLREHPRLFSDDVLYRLFEVEGGQRSSPAAADKYRGEHAQWGYALCELSRTGELDRERLLDGSLDALSRDFAAFRAGWFTRFHDRLAPTDSERAQRAEAYLRLAGSAIPATVSFAVKQIARLYRSGAVELAALARALSPALLARQKGTVKQAAKLLVRAVDRTPASATVAIESLCDALAHPAADVQATLLDGIDALLPLAGAERGALLERLADCHDLVAPSLRDRLPAAAPELEIEDEIPASPVGVNTDPLDEIRAVELARSATQAIDRVAYALEHQDDPIAQEIALDAIARYADPPPDWPVLCGPLRKRARSLFGQRGTQDRPLQLALTYLALVWTGRERPDWTGSWYAGSADFDIYFGRIDRLADRVLAGRSLPLLSTPSHRGGHIDPGCFYTALRTWSPAGAAVDPHDAVLALLRLPPSERGRAYRQLDLLQLPPALDFDLSRHSFHLDVTAEEHEHYTLYDTTATPTPLPGAQRNVLDLPLAVVHGNLHANTVVVRWLTTVLPHDPQPLFARGAARLGSYALDEPLTTATHLEPAIEPWVHLGPAGHWLLALALAARGPRAVELAQDVAITGIPQDRVLADELAAVLARLLPTGMIKAKRVANALSPVASCSPEHAACVRRAITGGLRGDPSLAPRDIGALLTVLYELHVDAGESVQDPAARNWLENVARGGQVARMRKALLSL